MKILLNCLNYENEGAGVSEYAHQLSAYLLKRMGSEIAVIERRNLHSSTGAANILSRPAVTSSATRILYEQLVMPWLGRKFEILHCMDYSIPLINSVKTIATIHDLAMFNTINGYTEKQLKYKQFMINKAIEHADALVCVSNYTRNELVKRFPSAEEKAVTIHSGIAVKSYDLKQAEAVQEKHGVSNTKYMIFVGTLSPHKNVDALIKAFEILKEEDQFSEYKLLICGKLGWLYDSTLACYESSKFKSDILLMGYVPDNDLRVLMAKAELFVTCSYHEGFGFPPLEALSLGTCVAVSNIPVFNEICGDSAFYFDPFDHKDIAKTLRHALKHGEHRKLKLDQANERLEYFNWDRAAHEIGLLYEKLLSE